MPSLMEITYHMLKMLHHVRSVGRDVTQVQYKLEGGLVGKLIYIL